MTPNKTRQILAAQKLRLETTPQPIDKLPPLTAEQRKAIYSPRSAAAASNHLQGEAWVNTWQQTQRPRKILRAAKGTAKATGVFFGLLTAIAGGILIGEGKRGLYS